MSVRSDVGRRGRFGPALLLALALQAATGIVSAQAAEASADADYEAGVELTREGRYTEALQRFIAAERAGENGARLQFNLGVVYYRLAHYPEARAAFDRAAQDPETADLAVYNLGLVALAAGDREEATRRFRQTAQQAKAEALRALAHKALEKSTGRRASRGGGSLSVLRGNDSNVVVPIAAGDLPSAMEDDFWEARGGWVDSLGNDFGYRVSGVALQYDEVRSADLGFAEASLNWRGPVAIEAGGSVLSVGDRGYQRGTDLRVSGAVYDEGSLRIVYEVANSWLASLGERTRDLDGTRLAFGASFELQQTPLMWTFGIRRIVNDRRAAALSPEQNLASLRVRFASGRWGARAWARYTDGSYPTERHDRTSEFGADLALRVFGPCDVVIEATRLDNRSSAPEFDYASKRLYAGLRLRF